MISFLKMERMPPSYLLLFFLTLITSRVSSQYTRPGPRPLVSSEYTRPGPRPLVSVLHKGSDSDPQQVHISLAGKNYMRISWVTSDRNAQSVVDYGKLPGKYEKSATGQSSYYRYVLYKSGAIHHVKIGPLEPGKTYYYRCGGFGQEFSFRTPPAAFPIEFVVAGDLGQTEWTSSTLAHIGAKDYDVLLLPGDLSYADTIQPLWDSFARLVEPYASTRPWMVTEGNHEIEMFPLVHHFKAYNERWVMPYNESGSGTNLYYSFDVVGVHIIMLGSYTEFSDQYIWLQKDLTEVDRTKTPWIFVLIHAPWYNSNAAHQGEGEVMRRAMEQLLYEGRVDVVFAGHVHAYERFNRVYDNKANQCGPIHVTIGDGGNREGLATRFVKPSPAISMYREPSFGHGRLRIVNGSHAHWSWHRNNESNAVQADEIWLESLTSTRSCKGNSILSKSGYDSEL